MRADLADRRIGYLLAVARDHRIGTGIGIRRAIDRRSPLAAGLAPDVRRPRRQGPPLVRLGDGRHFRSGCRPARHRLPLVVDSPQHSHRRNGVLPRLLPTPVPLAALVRVAGTRWKIEESFQSGKELAAPDEHQLRRWTSWHRWTILAILAHAFLSVMTATQPPPDPDSKLIPLTRNEIRRLFVYLLTRTVRTARQISTGHDGGADTKPEPEPATTADKPAH